MSHNSVDKLVKMANQIGQFFGAQAQDTAAGMADHLVKFWDPRMRAAIIEHVDHGGAGLDPIAIDAVKRLAHSGHILEQVSAHVA
ncbi:formate dehydrogenase subunit delta [Methylocystis sp. ATCC 49242]|uniref:formate dehydrogenase subunit delta n=1 Tax=Methylocystis sp. ATCC 49242 TaxID=622637 RepID=UPI0001F87404|nr:formate dehydrogenase subunit delta [Methylocystis sp. ATCC 49242]